jgi:single-stranded-DNA-specific exonuclease
LKIKQLQNTIPAAQYGREFDTIDIVLANRGVKDIDDFFNIDWINSVQSPYDLDNITEAAKKILDHATFSEKIAIIIDCDVDGFTSAAVLVNYLRASGKLNADLVFLYHEGKVHGLSDVVIMRNLRDVVKPSLLIVPDASGTDEQYGALNDLGIDIVVLDHHDLGSRGNNENLIVVNNQHSKKYENKFLSGVGVVWQVCRVMDDILRLNNASRSLDLVAIGLVADMMDLKSKETRFLIQEGLKLERLTNPLVGQCLFSNEYNIKGSLNPIKVAFQIAPLFNAISRIGSIAEKDLLFQSLLNDAREKTIPSGNRNTLGNQVPLVVEAYRIITNAKGRQTRRQNQLMKLIDEIIIEEYLIENKVILVAIGDGDFKEEYRGLAGLVCNKLQDQYQRPIIIIFSNGDGTFSGSCRAPSAVEAFKNFKEQCEQSKLCRYALGHSVA